jgi:hypothetical protein
LTHAQWENTVRDLFSSTQPTGLSDRLRPDPPLGRFDNNVARLTVSAGHWQDYQRSAEAVAEMVVADPALLAAAVPADLPTDPAQAGPAFVASFGARAFRRPLSAAEIDRYAALFAGGPTHFAEVDATTAGVRLVIEAMLQSPYFLYRTETSAQVAGGAIKLDAYEVASRLSYAFWNTMPDQAVFQAAAAGELDTEDGVRAQADLMFEDPRTRAQFDHFHFQAFEMREYTDVDKDPNLFPQWNTELGQAMQTEMSLFLQSVVFEGGSVRDFLVSPRAFVNAELAEIYGLEGSYDQDYTEVELDPSQRAGFLTRVGFLTRNATLADPDPIHRGVFINLNLLCRPLSALPNLPDNLMPVGDTNRERINSLTGPGTCGEACHATTINPLGFALENYDALGQWRTQDNGFPVDAADTYTFEDGRPIDFQNGVELSAQLADAPEVHACYVQQLLEYLYGRDLTEVDQPLVEALAADSLAHGMSVRELVIRVVSSAAFRYRAPN